MMVENKQLTLDASAAGCDGPSLIRHRVNYIESFPAGWWL